MTDGRVEVRQDPARLRPSDVRVLQADSNKFRALTGWEPEIPFERTMGDLLEWWRCRLSRRGLQSERTMGVTRVVASHAEYEKPAIQPDQM